MMSLHHNIFTAWGQCFGSFLLPKKKVGQAVESYFVPDLPGYMILIIQLSCPSKIWKRFTQVRRFWRLAMQDSRTSSFSAMPSSESTKPTPFFEKKKKKKTIKTTWLCSLMELICGACPKQHRLGCKVVTKTEGSWGGRYTYITEAWRFKNCGLHLRCMTFADCRLQTGLTRKILLTVTSSSTTFPRKITSTLLQRFCLTSYGGSQ